jgi:hypothetical protein
MPELRTALEEIRCFPPILNINVEGFAGPGPTFLTTAVNVIVSVVVAVGECVSDSTIRSGWGWQTENADVLPLPVPPLTKSSRRALSQLDLATTPPPKSVANVAMPSGVGRGRHRAEPLALRLHRRDRMMS